ISPARRHAMRRLTQQRKTATLGAMCALSVLLSLPVPAQAGIANDVLSFLGFAAKNAAKTGGEALQGEGGETRNILTETRPQFSERQKLLATEFSATLTTGEKATGGLFNDLRSM